MTWYQNDISNILCEAKVDIRMMIRSKQVVDIRMFINLSEAKVKYVEMKVCIHWIISVKYMSLEIWLRIINWYIISEWN